MLSTAFLLAASMVLGQADGDDSDQKHVQELSWLIGRWEGQFVLPEGIPDLGPPGSIVSDEQSLKWILNKRFIQYNFTSRIDGEVASEGMELIGWDASSEQLRHWFFGSTGIHGSGVWRRDGEAWVLDWSGTTPDKTAYSGSSVHRLLNQNTYTWQMTKLTKNGKKLPDWPVVEYKRQISSKPKKEPKQP
jgi:hypothetical protein